MMRGRLNKNKVLIIFFGAIFLSVAVMISVIATFIHDRSHYYESENIPWNLNLITGYTGELIREARSAIIKNKIDPSTLIFDDPELFLDLQENKFAVFHPAQGNILYSKISENYMENEQPGVFNFNTNIVRLGYGDDQKGEVIAFLPGIKKDTCLDINKRLGIEKIYRLQSDQAQLYLANTLSAQYKGKIPPPAPFDNPALHNLDRGCFQSYNGDMYVFFGVIAQQ